MKINRKIIVGMGVALCAGIAFYSIRGSLTPYVSFADARTSRNPVQIIGKLAKAIPVRHEDGLMHFTIEDAAQSRMAVAYRGPKPLNFEHADQAVVVGRYNASLQRFDAEKLLIKCPSKYTAGAKP